MQPGAFVVQNHEYQSSMFKGFEELRKSMKFFDVNIVCSDSNERILYGHKVILSSASGVFRKILSQQMTSNQSNVVVYLHSVSYQTLSWLLDFIYTGSVNVPEDYLESFIQLSTELQILGLAVEEIIDPEENENENLTCNQLSILRDQSRKNCKVSSSILELSSGIETKIHSGQASEFNVDKMKHSASISTTKNSFRIHSDTTTNTSCVPGIAENSTTLVEVTDHSSTLVDGKSEFFENSHCQPSIPENKILQKDKSKNNDNKRCKSPDFYGFDGKGIAHNSMNKNRKLCIENTSSRAKSAVQTIILDDIEIWKEISCLGKVNDSHINKTAIKKETPCNGKAILSKTGNNKPIKSGMCEVKAEKNEQSLQPY